MDIVEKLKQERIEKQKQRQAELEKYEAELTAKRDQRKAQRQAMIDKERISSSAITSLTAKNIQESLKIVEVGKVKEEEKLKDIESKQKQSQNKRETDRDIWAERRKRMQELVRRRKQLRIPPRPKRYIVQPAEFYGLDFSISNNTSLQQRQDELLDLFRKREEELLQDPEKMAALVKAGNAIVRGLHDIARIDKNRVQQYVKSKKAEADTEADPASDNPRGNSLEDFMASLNDLSSPITIDQEQVIVPVKKKWIQEQNRGQIDYSDYFPATLGTKDGINVFRIEELQPKLLPKTAKIGRFCLGDCYIVLHTYMRDDGNLDCKIYQWVGESAALDKKACSAIFSVALRDTIQMETEVSREESHFESKEFRNAFLMYDLDFGYESADKAVESGLYTVEERAYPLLMYKIFSKRKRRRADKDHGDKKALISGNAEFELVEPTYTSLRSRNVFLIDHGLVMYQWNGADSSVSDRSKCRLFADRIRNFERPPGKSMFQEFDEGYEPDDFWTLMDGKRNGMTPEEEEDESIDEPPKLTLYVFDASLERKGTSGLEVKNLVKFTNNLGDQSKPNRDLLKRNNCIVLDTGHEIFFWTGKKSSSRLRVITEAILMAKIYEGEERQEFTHLVKLMEGVESEAFKARFENWDTSMIKQIDYRDQHPDAENKKEPMVKMDISALFTSPPAGRNTKEEEDFFEGLFQKANALLQSLQTYVYDSARKKFINIPEWSQEKVSRERGHFYSEETYIFLCVYRKQVTQEESEINELNTENNNEAPVEEEEEDVYECVTYLWIGRNSPKPSFALLTFQHQFRKTIEDLVYKISEGRMEMRVVQLNQEKESLALLAHLDREYAVHSGKRPKLLPDLIKRTETTLEIPEKVDYGQVCMYHIRHDPKYNTTRAVQLTPMLTSLCTRDCYLVFYAGGSGVDPNTKGNTFLWIGKGASKDEERYAHRITQRIIDMRLEADEVDANKPSSAAKHNGRLSVSAYTNELAPNDYQVVKEKIEPKAFWRLIAPAFTKPSFNAIPYGQGFYYSLPPPRLFRCSTDSGFFRVEDFGFQFNVTDLHSDSVCLLDSGPGMGKPHIVYAWLGRDVSDVVIKLTKKAVDSYFDHLNDGRSLDRSEWDSSDRNMKQTRKQTEEGKVSKTGALRMDLVVVKDGSETPDFRVFFLGWGDTYRIDGATETEVEKLKKRVLPLTARSEEPMNQFLREEKERKRLAREARLKKKAETQAK